MDEKKCINRIITLGIESTEKFERLRFCTIEILKHISKLLNCRLELAINFDTSLKLEYNIWSKYSNVNFQNPVWRA
jgi:hypothetical protein